MRGIYTALLQGDRAAGSMLDQAGVAFNTSRELENYRTQVLFVPARVVSSVVVSASKWRYEWAEVRFTESTRSIATKAGGLNNTDNGWAYNWNELNNTATNWKPLGGTVNVPVGFTLRPIAANTPILLFPVRDTTGALFWIFDKVNAIDGTCPNPITEEPGEPE